MIRTLALLMCSVSLASWYLFAADAPAGTRGGGFTDDPAEIARIDQQVAWSQQSMRQISIREVNLIHKRFIDQCLPLLPEDVTIAYLGDVVLDNGRRKMKIITDDVSHVLRWHVQSELVIFDFWVSVMKTPDTITACQIESATLYLNVDFVHQLQGVEKKLPELNQLSVRDVLSHMEMPNPKLLRD